MKYNIIVYNDGEEVRRHNNITDAMPTALFEDMIREEIRLGNQLFIEDAEEKEPEEEAAPWEE